MKRFALFMLFALLSVLVLSVTAQEGDTYYVKVRAAKVREEANTRAAVVVTLARNTAVVVLEVVEGTKVSGSTVWYKIDAGGEEGFIHSSLVTATAPATASTSGNISTAPASPTSPPIIVSSGGGASCNGARTCGQMASCDQAYACLAAGQSSLDRDHDGVPCESICPGG